MMTQEDKGKRPGRSDAGARRAAEREARLAKALRDNLRRRKAQAAERQGAAAAPPAKGED